MRSVKFAKREICGSTKLSATMFHCSQMRQLELPRQNSAEIPRNQTIDVYRGLPYISCLRSAIESLTGLIFMVYGREIEVDPWGINNIVSIGMVGRIY